ncbi:MAG: hypothetical protein HQ488_00210 [Parcubacteria group bacterium]|nr:hypothetical protein [Parcubacteria group bacterium]
MNDYENGQPLGGAVESSQAQPSSPPPKPKRPVGTYVIAVVLILGAILIANIQEDDPSIIEDTRNITVVDPVANVVVTIDKETGEEVRIDLTDFVTFTELSNFDDLDEATTIINSAQGKPVSGEGSEKLVFGVVESQSENMVYFATSDYNQDTGDLFSGIYHYNTVTNRWQRIYKQTFKAEEGSPTAMFRVIGRLENSLILLKDFVDNSPGPCSNVWLMGDDGSLEMFMMDLAEPYSGLSQFPLPEILRQRAQTEQQTCMTETFGS